MADEAASELEIIELAEDDRLKLGEKNALFCNVLEN